MRVHKYTPASENASSPWVQARNYFLTGESPLRTPQRGFHKGMLRIGHLRYAPWTATPISIEEAQYMVLRALYLLHRVIHQTTEYSPWQGPTDTAITRVLGAVIQNEYDWTHTQDLLNQDERGFLQALALRLSLTRFTWEGGGTAAPG